MKRCSGCIGYCIVLVILLPLILPASDLPKTILVKSGGIACSNPEAARVGLRVLHRGGNAIDALCAVAITMAVNYPQAGNLGGGGFLLFRNASGNKWAIDFREVAPAAARFGMYWNEQGNPIPEKSRMGALAVGVPGTVRGLYRAHRMFGTLPWHELIEPAIRLAEEGFVVDSTLSNRFRQTMENFRRFPASFYTFFPDGVPPRPGDTLRQPDLARTLKLIAGQGDSGFYDGEVAERIVRTVERYGGIITRSDLASYRAVERTPVKVTYRGYTIYSMPPPSSGGLVLQGILNTLQFIDLSKAHSHNQADYIAFLSEVEKQWYAKRNLYLGDPDFVKIPLSLFASLAESRKILHNISAFHPVDSRRMPEYHKILLAEKHQTTHISIVDAAGNAVAMSYTLNGSFGSFLMAEGTGVLLNNEMDDFSIKPGYPNLYGLVQGYPNAIEPGKRMLSSMSPTIVVKDDQLMGVLGTPGGATIITTVLQILLNKIDYRMSLDRAVTAGRFHQQWLPDSIFYEAHQFSPDVISELRRRQFRVVKVPSIGDIQAIWRKGKEWEVASDPRGSGYPMGY